MMLVFSLPVIIMLVILSVITYHQATQALEDQVKRSASFSAASVSSDIQGILGINEGVVSAVANQLAVQVPAEPELKRTLEYLTTNSPGVQDLYVGIASGRFIDGAGWVAPADFDFKNRPWYKQAVESQSAIYTEVFVDSNTQKPIISVARAIRSNGQIVGVVAADLKLDEVIDRAKAVTSGKTGGAFVLSRDGSYVYHSTLKMDDNILNQDNGAFAELGKIFLSGQPAYTESSIGGVEKIYASAPVGKTGWAVVVNAPRGEVFESVAAMGKTSFGLSVVAVILLLIIIFYVAKTLTKPLVAITDHLQEMGDGNFSKDIPKQYLTRNDEIGAMAQMCEAMTRSIRNIVKQVNQSAEQLAASSEQLTASSEQSTQAADQIASSITSVAAGTNEQMGAAQEASAVVEQMSSSIQQVAANANQVADHAAKTAEKATDGNSAVEKVVIQMNKIEETVSTSAQVVTKLGERSHEIGQIVDTISGIAGQTNLLALNAAIEAARAGEQGRGFAVVAEEVRKLAEQSQEAAKKIAELIGEIQEDTDKAVVAMNDGTREVETGAEVVNATGTAFREITELVTQVSGQVKEISAAIQQMASGSQRIVNSVKRIDELSKTSAGESQSVSAASEEQLASMEEIASSSEALAKLAQDLQVAVAKFRI